MNLKKIKNFCSSSSQQGPVLISVLWTSLDNAARISILIGRYPDLPPEQLLSILVDLLHWYLQHLFPQVRMLLDLLLGTVYGHGKVGAVHCPLQVVLTVHELRGFGQEILHSLGKRRRDGSRRRRATVWSSNVCLQQTWVPNCLSTGIWVIPWSWGTVEMVSLVTVYPQLLLPVIFTLQQY